MGFEVRHTDTIGSILWLLVAAGVFVTSDPFPAGTGETGPAFYPRVIAVLIALFASIQLAKNVSADEHRSHDVSIGAVKQVAGAVLLVVAYVLSLPWLGFVAATVAFLVVAMWYSGARSIPRIGGVAVGMSLVLYYAFVRFLRIPLPEGYLLPVEDLLPGLISSGLTVGVVG